MKPYKKLSESVTFRLALLIPTALGLALLIISATINENYEICLSSNCINYFFELYKYPLSLLGMSVPLTAIAAAIHRSEEASLQIEETIRQNKFNNYIKHKEEFFDFLKRLEINCDCVFSDPLSLYKKIFPNNNYSSFNHLSGNQVKTDNLPENPFLDDLKNDAISIFETLYDKNTDRSTLNSLILKIDEITRQKLGLKQSKSTFENPKSILLVWPDNFAQSSSRNILTISKNLSSFALHIPKDDKNDRFTSNLRLPNSGKTKFKNMEEINKLATGIDDFL
ncbi:hypothetical protein HU733_09380 [Pseudomonas paralactis]|uniref:hypothetical protein n=1 Tax=Pseudomonas paralactis TaxID=1615673 RepID=UPI00164945C1|nr:hypothetical protein [Pseudomonas paralactis]MBC3255704.1 hypothetical protein [Pseudomonas paralactis]